MPSQIIKTLRIWDPTRSTNVSNSFVVTARSPSLSLVRLPIDVLFLIFEHLQWPYDLHALTLVCRELRTLSTPLLYRTVVFPYARPNAMYALLCKLEMSPDYCALIQTLIFDDVAKPLRPDIPDVGEDFEGCRSTRLENRLREPIARRDWLLDQIHHKLYTVLPLLNIKSLFLKRLHPVFLSPPLSHRPPSLTATKKVKDAILNHVPVRQWRNYQQPPPSERLPAAIGMFFTHCRGLTHLTIYDPLSLASYWPHSFVGNLTVLILALNLDHVIVELDCGDRRAMQLNSLLRRAKNLRTLGILTTWLNLTVLLEDCYFPHLESIEWFHYRAKNPKDPQTFYDFLRMHSATLRHIALAPVAYILGNWGYMIDADVPHWLAEPPYDCISTDGHREEGFLPHLETLRLHNWLAWSTPQPVYSITSADKIHAALLISNFIIARPSIVDVALTDFPSEIGRMLLEGMHASRQVKRAIVGKEERLLRDRAVPLYPPLSALHHPDWASGTSGSGLSNPSAALVELGSHALSVLNPSTLLNTLAGGAGSTHGGGETLSERARVKAYWAFARKREYLMEAYHSYSIMFDGLALENSAFRPYLLPRRRNAKRDYRR
ncbi:SubName: Full=Uncharacterized protein {ECO:0000313/EMBL:CCA74108.1} [Serendipita indica DSM 11827]|uniref:F-box domain-containing protein n=1 Tax=Serendipita indica (strain DSM 11827) TaxID=1109443 RepID=G4TS15_SERID|nr:SubName: Full=Uncharacterized protein {ECO:0000313/EMBL:CCA74108.1} [Serendipita indica DSM 11827]CCA74108.1 hypothetical protein PIIN_08062 [Serendipita indica DSM 11827]